MAILTDAEVLVKLYELRDTYLSGGKVMQKNITDGGGNTIFYRSLDDINSSIEYYENKLAYNDGGRVMIYG